jgi:multicomponent K+:H+ antiporter subunit D
MNHWLIAPIVLPSLGAAALALLRPSLAWQRACSMVVTAGLVVLGIGFVPAAQDGLHVYALGNWPAPFGIVLVLDRLAAMMLLVTAVIALCSLLYAMRGADMQGNYFHVLFLFQLMGLNGAFLTGDLFNLFVFFEVLLIASYCLLLHGGNPEQLKPGFHYVAINFAGSLLFLIAASLLYAMTGTLNMADMAQKAAAAPTGDAALIRAGALLLLTVFALKAALFPLYFWLPRAYSVAPAPAAALFAIMTKVGLYAILRVYTLIFGAGAGVAANVAASWLLPAALFTLVIATFGLLAGRTLRTMVGYFNIASVGIIGIGIGLFSTEAVSAALYYLLHSTLIIALLFLLTDIIRRGRGRHGDRIARGKAVPFPALLGPLFFGAGVAVVGIPPLSGFLGKVMLLQAAQGQVWIWSALLGNALLSLIALSRAGTEIFWHAADDKKPVLLSSSAPRGMSIDAIPVIALFACIVALTIWAGTAADYTAATARQLMQPTDYIQQVLHIKGPGRQ